MLYGSYRLFSRGGAEGRGFFGDTINSQNSLGPQITAYNKELKMSVPGNYVLEEKNRPNKIREVSIIH